MQEELDEGVARHGTTLVLSTAGQYTVLCQQSDVRLRGALIDIDESSGRALTITRVDEPGPIAEEKLVPASEQESAGDEPQTDDASLPSPGGGAPPSP